MKSAHPWSVFAAGFFSIVSVLGCASPATTSDDTTAPTTVLPSTAPLPDVGCDYTSTLNKSCAIAGTATSATCRSAISFFHPDTGLRTRLFNVIAPHADIDCNPNGTYMECVPTTCPTAKLIDSATPDNSWFIKKLKGTQGACR